MRCVALVAFVTFSAAVHGQAEWVKRDVANLGLWSSTFTAAYSFRHDRTFIYGYHNRKGTLRTSIWDGVTLREAPSMLEPSVRVAFATATPVASDRTLLYGGLVNAVGIFLGDSWEWDGNNWSKLMPRSSPPPLAGHSMAECHGGGILLFGGSVGITQLNLDTWRWDGSTWTRLTPVTSPPPRHGTAMAWDPLTQRVVLFGGFGGPQLLNDTWEWIGNDWVQANPIRRPPGRFYHSLSFDWRKGTMLLYGGSTSRFGGGLGDLWEWDGRNWTELFPGNMPGKMEHVALSHDLRRDRTVMFSSLRLDRSEPELWELRRGCEVAGAGGKSRPPALNCFTEPLIGTTFELLAPSPTGVAIFFGSTGPCSTNPQRLRSTLLCEPIGWLYPDSPTSTSWLLAGNPARLPLAIPPDPRLAGMHFCFQALTGEPYGCVRLSNAISVVVMQ